MGFLDFLKPHNKKKEKLTFANQQINQEAHAILYQYDQTMKDIKEESKRLDKQIDEAHAMSKRLQKILTTAELTFAAQGGKTEK